jgi:hypothetical protein
VSLLAEKYRDELGPIDDGLYFGNDELIPLFGHPGEGYARGDRQVLTAWLEDPQEDWDDLSERVRCESEEWTLVGGETSWEGAGFLALEDRRSGELRWLFHLHQSEPFLEVRIEGDVVVAVSGDYPDRYEWTVPLAAPEGFQVRAVMLRGTPTAS